jgi:mono/diheme cytochrome c family protein
MNIRHLLTLVLLGSVVLAGCGSGAKKEDASVGAAGASASGSKYDAGPRAAEASVDHELAEQGEKLFKDKGCSACHAFGARLSGPDLAGVAGRRTAAWLEQQILHPDVMTKEDPISRQLMAQHALQMPNQGLTPEEAKAVIEFLKSQEHPDDDEAESD